MSITPEKAALVESLPMDFLDQLPGIPPPPGQVTNFIDPPNLLTTMAVVIAISSFFMIAAVGLRIYSKLNTGRAFSWEDYTCFLAMTGSFAYASIAIYGAIHHGTGVHEWNVRVSTLISNTFLQMTLFSTAFYTPLVLMAKLSIFILYLRLFDRSRRTRLLAWGGIVACTIFYTFGMIFPLVSCGPWPGETRLVGLASTRCVRVITFGYVTTAFNILSDLYLVIIPIPVVIHLNMSKAKKIRVCSMFMLGILACACAIVNSYFRVLLATTLDLTYVTAPVLLISIVEINVGIIVGCMPVIQPAIFGRFLQACRLPSLRSLFSRLTLKSHPSRHAAAGGSSTQLQPEKPKGKPYLETRILHGADGRGNFMTTVDDGASKRRSFFSRKVFGTWTAGRRDRDHATTGMGLTSSDTTRAINHRDQQGSNDHIVVTTNFSTDGRSSQENDPHRQYLQQAERTRNLV